MNPEHKGSHKANRNELFKSPPAFGELIQKIKVLPGLSKEERAFFSIVIGSGARVSEVCGVRVRDLTFYGTKNIILKPEEAWSTAITKIEIRFTNLKNKKNKIKTAVIIRSTLFMEIVDWIAERYQEAGFEDLDKLMYSKGRKCAYWLTKQLGDDWFPHIFRHYYISNLAKAGVSPQTIQKAAGWQSLDQFSTYAHLNTQDIEDQLTKHYGDKVPLGVDDRPLSMHQALGAIAAATEVKEIIQVTPKNQMRKMSVLHINGNDIPVRLTKEARFLRDKLKNDMVSKVIINKVEEVKENDVLQLV